MLLPRVRFTGESQGIELREIYSLLLEDIAVMERRVGKARIVRSPKC